MKHYISTFFLFFIVLLGDAFSESNMSDNEYLTRAKFKLISGDIAMSEFYLKHIREDQGSKILPIKKRYLALIEFIRGNHKESNKILHTLKENETQIGGLFYKQTCLLQILNSLALNEIDNLKKLQKLCFANTAQSSKNDQYWLDTVIKLKLHDLEGLKSNLFPDSNHNIADDEITKLWFKTGLYLNREADFLKLLRLLDEDSYQSKRLGEIISFMYLRTGNFDKALSFINNVDSANSENIKGNISLQKKEYELAFGHFKLAIQKKQDSINALERTLPLSWILNQYDSGLSILDNSYLKNIEIRNRRALKISYLLKLKKFNEAEKELLVLVSEYNNIPPKEVFLMNSYLSIMQGATATHYDRRLSEEISEKACRSFDGLNCWIAFKLTQWDNLGKSIQRDDKIFSDPSVSLDSLKSPVAITPLKEDAYVDQGNIEELDSKDIMFK
jgi:hypothetical protein